MNTTSDVYTSTAEVRGLCYPLLDAYTLSELASSKRLIGPTQKVRIGSLVTQLAIGNQLGSCRTYWTRPKTGFKAIMEYLCDLFRTEIHTVITKDPRVLRWVQSRSRHVKDVSTYEEGVWSSEDYKFVIEECTPTHLVHYATPPEGFEYSGPLPQNLETLIVRKGSWITGDHLLNMNSMRKVDIKESKIDDSKIIDFLKKWKTGGFSKLERFMVDRIEGDTSSFLGSVEMNELGVWRQDRVVQGKRGKVYRFKEHFIPRNDGTIAKITHHDWNTDFEMEIVKK